MPRKRHPPRPLPTIWRVPDDLWATVQTILGEINPPKRTGRKRIDPRGALDAIIFRYRLREPAEEVEQIESVAGARPWRGLLALQVLEESIDQLGDVLERGC